jgi:hypothetical protein
MSFAYDTFPLHGKSSSDRSQKSHRGRKHVMINCSENNSGISSIYRSPSKGAANQLHTQEEVDQTSSSSKFGDAEVMSGSQDSDGIILCDIARSIPHGLSSSQKSSSASTPSSETNQLWLKMRRQRADLTSAEDASSISEKADAILLNLPLHSNDAVSDITTTYRMNLEALRTSNSKQNLNGATAAEQGKPEQIRIGTSKLLLGKKEVTSPYNSDHCLTSAVIYPKDSATLQESNVIRYERNPMIYNSALGKQRPPPSVVKKKIENSSDSVVDDIVNNFEYESLFPDEDLSDNLKLKRSAKKEREGFGTLIESLSYKLAVQIESLQASIVKKDERIEELERAAIEQLNSEFNFKMSTMLSAVTGKEKEIQNRTDETDNKLAELLSLLGARDNSSMSKNNADRIKEHSKERSALLTEIELLKNKNEVLEKVCSSGATEISDPSTESAYPLIIWDSNTENSKIFSTEEKISLLKERVRTLEEEHSSSTSNQGREGSGKNSPVFRNNCTSVLALEKLNNNEVVTICYSVEEIDKIINKFPVGIDDKGDTIFCDFSSLSFLFFVLICQLSASDSLHASLTILFSFLRPLSTSFYILFFVLHFLHFPSSTLRLFLS